MDDVINYTLEDMDRQSLFHPLTSIAKHQETGPHIIAGGQGIRLRDSTGREMIDGGGGLG
jgi:L-2,4-diaminobutyrate transaminase